MSVSDVTVVCCWNDEKVYGDFVETLKAQTCPCELIGIDNRGNKGFTSCAAAYNSVIDQVKTKYVIYSHQDILLNEPDTLAKFVSRLEQTGPDDIAGAAGTRFDTKGTFADFKHLHKQTGEFVPAGNPLLADVMEGDTVDECFFGGHTEHFRQNPFDEVLCNGWHLYAAEACLRTKSNHVGGGGILIFSTNLEHLSNGNISFSFVRDFCKLCRKYSSTFPLIRVTCAQSRTDNLHLTLYLIKYTLYTRPRRALVTLIIKLGLYRKLRKILGKE